MFPIVSTLNPVDQARYGRVSGFCAASHARSVGGSTERASGDGASAAASVSPSGKRPAGSGSRQRSIAAASAEGIPGATLFTLGGVSTDCLTINAVTLEMFREIDKALDEFEADPAVGLILLEGAGERGLCAGGDIRSLWEDSKVAGNLGKTLWC